ncbi:MAG: glycosyltransferase [Planctomycetes bacterium]|nr:glycosyltransferase [Planctomycetota bacterium]
MRILALTPMLPWPLTHGGRIRTHALLAGLAADHEIVVLAGSSQEDSEAAAAALARSGVTLRSATLTPRHGALSTRERVTKLWMLLRGRSSLLPRFYSREMAELVRREASRKVDAIMLDHVWMAPYLPLLPRAPLLFSTHNVESALIRDKARDLPWSSRMLALREAALLGEVEAMLARTAQLTLTVSAEDKHALDAVGARAAEVVSNGVHLTERPLLSPAAGHAKLLFVGGADYAPNAAAALCLAREVLPLVRREIPDAEALLVGADPTGLLEPVRGLPGVRLLGALPDMLPAWQECHLLLAPLRHGGGSRLKLLEAFAVGRPVVSTRVGAAGLPVQQGRNLLLAESPAELAASAVQILRDVALRESLVRAARQVAEAHDWAKIQRQLRTVVSAAFGRDANSDSAA